VTKFAKIKNLPVFIAPEHLDALPGIDGFPALVRQGKRHAVPPVEGNFGEGPITFVLESISRVPDLVGRVWHEELAVAPLPERQTKGRRLGQPVPSHGRLCHGQDLIVILDDESVHVIGSAPWRDAALLGILWIWGKRGGIGSNIRIHGTLTLFQRRLHGV
jgi:hypothetical protein